MVKLTVSLIEKKCLQQQYLKSFAKEIDKNHLKKITHIFMNENSIDDIDDISVCSSVRVIYLQRNSIVKIENLDFAINLTHLYLQHNEISKIENLSSLVNLKKLYLGFNNISVIEGMENLSNLTELHIEKQRLGVGERLCIDPRSAATLSTCLTHLNITGNKLTSLNEVMGFQELTTLEAKDNLIDNIEDLTETVITLIRLKQLFLQGNPVTKTYRYRENIIANSDSLISLDEKYITENSRTFLQKFKLEKLQQAQRKVEKTFTDDITDSLNLPPAFKRSVSRAMFQNINPKFSFSGVSVLADFQPQIFPPWKSTKTVQGLKNNHVLPRPFWKNKSAKKITNDIPPHKNIGFPTFL